MNVPSQSSIEALSADEKRALLKTLLEQREAAASQDWPLTMGQSALWYLYQINKAATAYNTGFALHITTPLDIAALQTALEKIYQRHPILGATFFLSGSEPVCRPRVILPAFEIKELYGFSAAEVHEIVTAAYRQPFDLEGGVVSRCCLFTLAPDTAIFLFSIHHIIYDDGATSVILSELLQAYLQATGKAGLPVGMTTPTPFGLYALQERQLLTSPKGETLRHFWASQVEAMPEIPSLVGYAIQTTGTSISQELGCNVPASLYPLLKESARRQGVTVFSWLLAVLQITVSRYTRAGRNTIGIPVSGRENKAYAGTVGYFVNLLPVCMETDNTASFAAHLKRSVQTFSQAYLHKDYPFAAIAALPEAKEKGDIDSLVPVVFNYLSHSAALPERLQQQQSGGLAFSQYHVPSQEDAFDITFEMRDDGTQLLGCCKYRAHKYDQDVIQSLCDLFQYYLEQSVLLPELRLDQLKHILPAEMQRLQTWNETTGTYAGSWSLISVFQANVAACKERVALYAGGHTYTYEELDKRSSQLAAHLQTCGVRRGMRIGLLLKRDAGMIISILGVLKAGAAYVPVDAAFPVDRIRYMLQTADCRWLIHDVELPDNVVAQHIYCIDVRRQSAVWSLDGVLAPVSNDADDLAYIMYTSGSTGRPKGVLVKHRSIVNLVKSNRYVDITAEDRCLLTSNYVFDGSTFEIFGALLNGAALFVPTEDELFKVDAFKEFIRTNHVNIAFWTTAFFNKLVDHDPGFVAGFDYLFFGGETVSLAHVQKAFPYCKRPGSMVHVYGPTECTTFSTFYPVNRCGKDMSQLPIGRPLTNVQLYVLDDCLLPVPIGVCGELYIGGLGVSVGYLSAETLTTTPFIAAPWNGQQMLYATGDIACWRPDGNIHFVGRKDQQIKFRGYRVEPGEIVAALNDHPKVQHSTVQLFTDETGVSSLRAFVLTADASLSGIELHDFLSLSLPHYMIPASYYCLQELPLNTNGKIDLAALSTLAKAQDALSHTDAQPHTPMQELVAEAWERLLSAPSGIHDNFFARGGHSLMAGRLCAQLTASTGVDILLPDFIRNPTIYAISQYIENRKQMSAEQQPVARTIAPMRADREQFRRSLTKKH